MVGVDEVPTRIDQYSWVLCDHFLHMKCLRLLTLQYSAFAVLNSCTLVLGSSRIKSIAENWVNLVFLFNWTELEIWGKAFEVMSLRCVDGEMRIQTRRIFSAQHEATLPHHYVWQLHPNSTTSWGRQHQLVLATPPPSLYIITPWCHFSHWTGLAVAGQPVWPGGTSRGGGVFCVSG